MPNVTSFKYYCNMWRWFVGFIMENPFYYGEMRTKRGLMPHVYSTLVSKELWDMCQEQKAIRAGQKE